MRASLRPLLLALPFALLIAACSDEGESPDNTGGSAGERGTDENGQSDDNGGENGETNGDGTGGNGTGGNGNGGGGNGNGTGGDALGGFGGVGGVGDTGGTGGGAPTCDQVGSCTAESASCGGDVLTTCTTDGDGCLVETVTDCTGGANICYPLTGVPACVPEGSGDSCADARIVRDFPAQITGADLLTDFPTDSIDLDGVTNCSSTASADNLDAIFRVDLVAGDTLQVSEQETSDTVFSIIPAAADACTATTACLASTDVGEPVGISYEAVTDETVFVVLEPWSGTVSTRPYDLRINVVPQVCGDGFLSPGEACDDGNVEAGDGCAADCSSIETGFVCSGVLCYRTGTGDICTDDPGGPAIELSAGSYSFDVSGFALDYDGYGGDCGVSQVGGGPDVVFAIDVPGSGTVNVATPEVFNPAFDAVFVFATDCADITGSCAAWANYPAEAEWTNTSPTETTVYLVVDGYYDTSTGVLDFSVDIEAPVCGDGVIEAPEDCDDGLTDSGDGCDATCRYESGYVCVGEPSVCNTGIEYTSTPDLFIPSADLTGVSDTIDVTESCTVAGIEVPVDITHSWVGDLQLYLQSPAGTQVTLRSNSGGAEDDVLGTYPTTLTPVASLDVFAGQNTQGSWTLSAIDTVSGDDGTINSWGLTLVCVP